MVMREIVLVGVLVTLLSTLSKRIPLWLAVLLLYVIELLRLGII